MAAVTPGQREAQRRREAAGLLMITAATAAYASRQLQNGLTPAEAQMAMVEAAADMAAASLAQVPLAAAQAFLFVTEP